LQWLWNARKKVPASQLLLLPLKPQLSLLCMWRLQQRLSWDDSNLLVGKVLLLLLLLAPLLCVLHVCQMLQAPSQQRSSSSRS
jgi:hypothetical protein